jgi:hypothetical protein
MGFVVVAINVDPIFEAILESCSILQTEVLHANFSPSRLIRSRGCRGLNIVAFFAETIDFRECKRAWIELWIVRGIVGVKIKLAEKSVTCHISSGTTQYF